MSCCWDHIYKAFQLLVVPTNKPTCHKKKLDSDNCTPLFALLTYLCVDIFPKLFILDKVY
jgi:hypothetical protein